MSYKLFVGLVLLVSFVGCVNSLRLVKIHPNCPPIPETTFEKAGLDVTAGALQFGKLVTVGEVSVKTDPQIISGISQSSRDDQTTDALICASRERGELKTPEQIDHAWKVARFYKRNPSAAEAIEFHKHNPFPITPTASQTRKSPLKEGISADTVRKHFFQFHEEGVALVRELDKDTRKVSQETKRKVDAWILNTQTYIENNFADSTYAHRFQNFTDLPSPKIPLANSLGEEWMWFRGEVIYRIVRLDQYLLEKIE